MFHPLSLSLHNAVCKRSFDFAVVKNTKWYRNSMILHKLSTYLQWFPIRTQQKSTLSKTKTNLKNISLSAT